ncbi:MAG: thioredoxin family protein [Deltaproteobacteria bacterium]|jgi:small redox-active disulfide protein 2|nr:thioredoxin family protein [Deltaproteobacteria bacterium]
MKLTIFGSGCAKCNLLTQHAEEAARELGAAYELQKVTDMNQIIDAGVMRTPALAVDDRIVIEGKVPSANELKQYLA